ncbi:hypothetical protein FBU30_007063 [Linnemannia zychae]|nr:hypothetical protein FBU30_007063 [Linnemannia zychae]
MPVAVFLDSGGVINDNARRAPQWVRYLGEYLPTTVLGGNAQIWGQANTQMVVPFFRRWHEFMNQAIQLAAEAQTRLTVGKTGSSGTNDVKIKQDETNVYYIFERIYLLVWIKEMCHIASLQIPDLTTKVLPTLSEDDLFHLAKSTHVYAIQRVRAEFPGAIAAIHSIKSIVGRLYTSSGDSFEDLENILKGLGVFDVFDEVYGADRVNCLKISPEYYRRVFKAVGVHVISRDDEREKGKEEGQQGFIQDDQNHHDANGDEIVVVDDSAKALKWARELGARTVLITSSDGELDLSLDANRHIDYQLKALSDLPALLDSWKKYFELCQVSNNETKSE